MNIESEKKRAEVTLVKTGPFILTKGDVVIEKKFEELLEKNNSKKVLTKR